MHNLVHVFDDTLTHYVRVLPEWLDGFMQCVSFVGQPAVTILIIVGVIVYGIMRQRKLAMAGVVAGLVFLAGGLLKAAIHRHRPTTADLLHLNSYSFPSGHTLGSTLAYGLLAIVLYHYAPKRWRGTIAAAAVVIILLVGVSRVYLGAHYPSDVIAGWLFGGVGLAIIAYAMRALK